MNISRKMFLLAVEEMSFTKAACRAFVTQQCLSLHVKKLEDHYGVKLFERKPKLQLTTAGKSLYELLRQLEIIEAAISEQIDDIKEEKRGELTFGINATRGRVLVPRLITQYQKLFPLVKIAVVLDDMHHLAPMLLNGKLDMFLGIDCISNENFKLTPLGHDEVFFIARRSVLNKFAHGEQALEEALHSGVIDLTNFDSMPFVGNNDGSSFNGLVKKYLDEHNIQRDITFSVSDYEMQIEVCAHADTVAFCPQMVLGKIFEQNGRLLVEKELKVFKLKGMNDSLRLEIVTHKQAYQPRFSKEFIRMLKEQIIENAMVIDKAIVAETNK